MMHGHPTEALLVAARRYAPPELARALWTVLLRPVVESAELAVAPHPDGWTPPCGVAGGCADSVVCRAVSRRISALLHFAELVGGLVAPTSGATTAPPAGRDGARPPPGRGTDARGGGEAPVYGETAEAKVVNDAWMHVDAHMPLLTALDAARDLRAGGRCSDADGLAMLARAPVSIDFAYTELDLPDMSIFMPLTLAYGRKARSKKSLVQQKMPRFDAYNVETALRMVSIMYKGQYDRCANREFFDMIRAQCAQSEYVAEFYMHLVIASLLGVYRTARVKLRVDQRVDLYKCFGAPVALPEILGIMHAGNKNPLLYIIKEYFLFMSAQLPGFQDAAKELYDWFMFDKYTALFCDEMRRVVEDNMVGGEVDSLDALFAGADAHCRALHEKSRKTQRENGLFADAAAILALLNGYNYDRYVPADNPLPPPVPDELIPWDRRGRLVMPANPHPQVEPRIEATMRTIIERFPRERPVPPVWLVFFGVPPADVVAMTHTMYGKKPEMLRLVKSVSPRVYALFYTFFRLVKEYKEYREFRGDAFMLLCHARALNNAPYHVAPGAPIPRVAGRVQYCPVCGDVKTASFYPSETRNKNAKGLGTCMLTCDGRVVCARAPAPRDWREKEKEKPEEDRLPLSYARRKTANHRPKALARATAKGIGTDAMYDRCNFTETRTLNCLGRLTRFRRFLYIACYDCFRIVKSENKTFVGAKLLCKRCALAAARALTPVYKCEIPDCKNRLDPSNCFFLRVYDEGGSAPLQPPGGPGGGLDGGLEGGGAPPAPRGYRHAKLCSTHAGMWWIRNSTTIRCLEDVIQLTKESVWDKKHVRM